MEESLEEVLRSIDILPDYTKADKINLCNNTLEHWSRDSKLIYHSITGLVDLSLEYKRIARKIGGLMAFLPHFVGKEDVNKIREFGKIMGRDLINMDNNSYHLLVNPVGIGALGAIIALGTKTALEQYYGILLPERLLEYIGGSVGTLFGFFSSSLKAVNIGASKEKINYLDTKIRQYREIHRVI